MNQEYILTAIEDKCDSCTEICHSILLCVWSNHLPVFPVHHTLHNISLSRH